MSQHIDVAQPLNAIPGDQPEHGRGVILAGNITVDQWADLCRRAVEHTERVPWVVGDILAYGPAHFADWREHFDIDRAPETLRKWRQVAEAFPVERRRYNLTFTYYQRVAFLEQHQQNDLLTRAEGGEFNTTTLQRAVAEISRERGTSRTPKVVESGEPEAVTSNQQDDDRSVFDATGVGEQINREADAERRAEERAERRAAVSDQRVSDGGQRLVEAIAAVEALEGTPLGELASAGVRAGRVVGAANVLLKIAERLVAKKGRDSREVREEPREVPAAEQAAPASGDTLSQPPADEAAADPSRETDVARIAAPETPAGSPDAPAARRVVTPDVWPDGKPMTDENNEIPAFLKREKGKSE